MKFIYEKETKDKQLTLKDVEDNQFFVCLDGYLCQKINYGRYVTIADDKGGLICDFFEDHDDMPIKRILPRVEKIEF